MLYFSFLLLHYGDGTINPTCTILSSNKSTSAEQFVILFPKKLCVGVGPLRAYNKFEQVWLNRQIPPAVKHVSISYRILD